MQHCNLTSDSFTAILRIDYVGVVARATVSVTFRLGRLPHRLLLFLPHVINSNILFIVL